MEETERVILGITMGDPAGIGPEITVKALAQPGLYEICLLYTSRQESLLIKSIFTWDKAPSC